MNRSPSSPALRLGLVQMRISDDRAQNLARAIAGVREAKGRGAAVICLPELFTSPYFCQTEDPSYFDWAEPVPGPTTAALGALAKELAVTLLAPVFERRAPGVYHNSLAVLSESGELTALYRKMHIPDDPQYQEKFYFTPGDTGFIAVKTPHATLGPLICWDQWYPEAARLAVLRGAEILTYPTAIGWLPEEKEEQGQAQLDAWKTVQRAHAIANGVFVAAVNRVGTEVSSSGQIEFWGHSFVADPSGVVIAEAGEGEEVLVVECDLSRIEAVRRWWPFLRDRRIDSYGGLTARLLDD